MDVTLLELHVNDGLDFSPTGSIGSRSGGDDDETVADEESGSSGRTGMKAFGVLVLLALLAVGVKKFGGRGDGEMEDLEELDEMPA
ncbi:hypothetical protein [Halorarum salinum]|uniref:Uncharacterized protein n=1 Tax=Halorarum salinum TaxID=2743089 RepID=A0A7D5QBR1_9EURY|nr:hypothetical protein [Halobaculum salinum]QLG62758.1 hypothetical protein HUG12_13890 [Halobaculum salinum]